MNLMVQQKQPKLSWFFLLISITYVHVFGMEHNEYLIIDKAYELDELRAKFGTILETQPEFINLHSTESQYKAANGIYKLIPYYQKLSPEISPTDFQSSRFIIHKHVITEQWQLTEVDAYPCSRNIKAFPVIDENEKLKFISNHCVSLHQSILEQDTIIQNLKKEIKSKDGSIQSLVIQDESLLDRNATDLSHETIKGTEAYKQLEIELFAKENEINDANKKFEEKLFEKENEILEIKKELKVKIFEKEKQIIDSRAEFQKIIIKVKTEQNKMHREKIRLIKNEMNLEKSKLKTKYWEKQETLKENLCPEKFKQQETQINYLQNQLSKTESENNKLKMTQEILEKEKENLTNYNQNLSTQLTREKIKFKEMESSLKKNTKKTEVTSGTTTSKPPENTFKTIAHFKDFDNQVLKNLSTHFTQETKKLKEMESALKNDAKKRKTNILPENTFDVITDMVSNTKYINPSDINENAISDFEEEYTNMITDLENENKIIQDEFWDDLNIFYEDVNTKDFQIEKIKGLMEGDKKTLMADPNYTYEFVLIHYGAILHSASELTGEIDSDVYHMKKKLKYASPKMQNFWNNKAKFIWSTIMQGIYKNHEKDQENAIKTINDKALVERLNNLMDEPLGFEKKEYSYEFMITVIGTFRFARIEALEEFINIKKKNSKLTYL